MGINTYAARFHAAGVQSSDVVQSTPLVFEFQLYFGLAFSALSGIRRLKVGWPLGGFCAPRETHRSAVGM